MSSAIHTLGASFLIDSLMGWTAAHHEKKTYDIESMSENTQNKHEENTFSSLSNTLRSITNSQIEVKDKVLEDNQSEDKVMHSEPNLRINPNNDPSSMTEDKNQVSVDTKTEDSLAKNKTCLFKEQTGNYKNNQQEEVNSLLEKPNQSYIALISSAILSTPEKRLQLSDIYQWIMDTYPYYQNQDKSWRNSVRHNLSLNECFIKAGRSDNGKGHYWAVHPANIEAFSHGDYQRRRARRRIRRISSVLANPSPFPLYNLPCLHPRFCICCSPFYTHSSTPRICPLMEYPHQCLQPSLEIPHLLPWRQLPPYV